jgi:hypothetical protein
MCPKHVRMHVSMHATHNPARAHDGHKDGGLREDVGQLREDGGHAERKWAVHHGRALPAARTMGVRMRRGNRGERSSARVCACVPACLTASQWLTAMVRAAY